MKKDMRCMCNQISLTEHWENLKKEEEREYKRKVDYDSVVPFQFVVFRRAYRILKDKGKISRTDILEFKVPVCYEVYESLYLKVLNMVYCYCREQTDKENFHAILSNAYEKEYDWMQQRLATRYGRNVDTA